MGIRFIIGRAGSGKTHHCLSAIHRRLREDPVDGPRLIFLVPEQASHQMERAILLPGGDEAGGSIAASHRAEVLSFQRIAARALESAREPVRSTLSENARIMALGHIVAGVSSKLTYYRRAGRSPGFCERLGATIAEFIQEGVRPADLSEVFDATTKPSDGASERKLRDLCVIYEAYLAYLGTDRLDPSQYPASARACLRRCDWLDGAEMWVDGFASLSGEETATLVELTRRCSRVEIAVMLDPGVVTGGLGRRSAERLFGRTLRTYQELRRRFQEAGIKEEEPVIFRDSPTRRFAGNASLGRMEQRLFADGLAGSESTTDDRVKRSNGVSLVELPSRRVEVEYAVSRICEWTRSERPRYRLRDIALIVRDFDPYHDLIRAALDGRGIPYFIDQRRSISHHPLVELIRAGLSVAAGSMPLEGVRLLLKTGLTPLRTDEGDELENHLIAHGVEGWDKWTGGDWSARRATMLDDSPEVATRERSRIARINSSRRRIVSCLEEWMSFATSEATRSGAEWAEGLRGMLDRMGAGEALARWADEADDEGELDRAEEHRQIWKTVVALLEDLESGFAEETLSLEELAGALETGLASATLGLAPPTVDQLLVGSIERSRHPNIKAAIVLGFNEGVFPALATEDTILNDDDREALEERGVRIGASSRRRAGDEAMLAYVALTRASEELIVTYSRADDEGRALRPSPFVADLCAAVAGLEATAVGDPVRTRTMWDVQTPGDAVKRLAMEFRSRAGRDDDRREDRARWNELYSLMRDEFQRDAVLRSSMRSLEKGAEESLSADTIRRLYPGTLHTSVSRLESFAACPFRHFAEHVLCLREREEAEIAAVEEGKIHHAVLEEFARGMMARGSDFAGLDDAGLIGGLRESCERVLARLPAEGDIADARNAYMLRRSAGRLERVLRMQRGANASASIRPRGSELSFGRGEEGGLPGLEVSTPQGRKVVLRGVIDRVDVVETAKELFGVVVDYKDTRNKTLNLSGVYHGISLQLAAYLLVLAEHGEAIAGRSIRPAAAFYQSLSPQYHRVDHPSQEETRDMKQRGTFRPRGLIDFGRIRELGIGNPDDPAGWAPLHAVHGKKDGTPGHLERSDVADTESFAGVLEAARRRIGQLADDILSGAAAVSPYRHGSESPCRWCAMLPACRFEWGLHPVRFLEPLGRVEALKRMREEAAGGNRMT